MIFPLNSFHCHVWVLGNHSGLIHSQWVNRIIQQFIVAWGRFDQKFVGVNYNELHVSMRGNKSGVCLTYKGWCDVRCVDAAQPTQQLLISVIVFTFCRIAIDESGRWSSRTCAACAVHISASAAIDESGMWSSRTCAVHMNPLTPLNQFRMMMYGQ